MEQTTTAPLNASAQGEPVFAGPAVLGTASPLQSALNEQGEQIARLSELVGKLEERLAAVRLTAPEAVKQNVVGADVPPSSMVVGQLNVQINAIKLLQARVATLTQELEV